LPARAQKKENYLAYYDVAMELVRAGGAICFDDTLWSGRVVEDSGAFDAETEAIRALNDLLSKDPRVLR
jgi:predicted O-methyltransferase YrrM